jgi:hypothetical protein
VTESSVIQNALRILAAHCGKHTLLSMEQFIAAGGNECPICLRQRVVELQEENKKLIDRVYQLAERLE